MNLAKLQDTRSIYKIRLYFYMVTMSDPKMKLRKPVPFTIAANKPTNQPLGINVRKEV